MSIPTQRWAPQGNETYQQFLARTEAAKRAALAKRREQELFRLALTGLRFDRYLFGVEHGLKDINGPWHVHAYVVCKDCYKLFPGLVDPRTIVATPDIREELVPNNEVLAVGMNVLDAVKSMMKHEREHHVTQ